MKVCGIDPGNGGAFAVYDTVNGLESVYDMPIAMVVVGKKTRPRIDVVEVADTFDLLKGLDVKLIVIEAVGGRPRQSASAAFVFGYGVGLLVMAAIQSRIAIETPTPQMWKKLMRVPKDDAGIAMRFDHVFPDHRQLIRGPRGAIKHDRAEAAFLAKFGADFLLHSVHGDQEWRMMYNDLKTGA